MLTLVFSTLGQKEIVLATVPFCQGDCSQLYLPWTFCQGQQGLCESAMAATLKTTSSEHSTHNHINIYFISSYGYYILVD